MLPDGKIRRQIKTARSVLTTPNRATSAPTRKGGMTHMTYVTPIYSPSQYQLSAYSCTPKGGVR